MREIHGVADAEKIMMLGETDNISVKVVDRPNQKIEIIVGSSCGSSCASLTTEQAEFIANQLMNAIKRATMGEREP